MEVTCIKFLPPDMVSDLRVIPTRFTETKARQNLPYTPGFLYSFFELLNIPFLFAFDHRFIVTEMADEHTLQLHTSSIRGLGRNRTAV